MTEQSTYSQSPMGRMGEPPSGPLDYVIVAIAVVFVAAAAIQTVRRLIHPGEDAPDHIKRSVLLDDPDPQCLGGPGGVVGVCPRSRTDQSRSAKRCIDVPRSGARAL